MAAGVFNGKFTLTGAAQTLDTLTGGTQTYNVITFRRVSGFAGAALGNAAVTLANGLALPLNEQITLSGAIAGANVGLIGAGAVVEFFGNATA